MPAMLGNWLRAVCAVACIVISSGGSTTPLRAQEGEIRPSPAQAPDASDDASGPRLRQPMFVRAVPGGVGQPQALGFVAPESTSKSALFSGRGALIGAAIGCGVGALGQYNSDAEDRKGNVGWTVAWCGLLAIPGAVVGSIWIH